jgi:hypothetical protein
MQADPGARRLNDHAIRAALIDLAIPFFCLSSIHAAGHLPSRGAGRGKKIQVAFRSNLWKSQDRRSRGRDP